MAKRRHQREELAEREVEHNEVNEVHPTEEPPRSTEESSFSIETIASDPLVDEVQLFLERRTALAKKLADEIAATEKKLADLRKTAAMLFPEQPPSNVKDRKAKKLKTKPAARHERPEATPSHSDVSTSDAS
jgi:hypothetical protein